MALLALLPPLAGLAWAAWFWRRSDGPLDALLKASLVFVWLCFAFSEGLGALHALIPSAALAAWCLAAALPLLLARREEPRSPPAWKRPSSLPFACLALAALIAGITLCLALGEPQWNLDSQLYHLPRVEQWVQNRSLALFPTPYDLQDFFPAGTEMVALQFRLLAGSAAFAGLVQWFAYVLGGAAVAGCARSLGGSHRAQALAVLAWAATPMAVLQSSTAQSDLAAAFGAVLTAYFCLRHDRDPERGWDLWAAAALGAALMLKGTDYLFVPAFGLWLVPRRGGRGPRALRLALLLLLAAAPSLPSWARNAGLCGSPLGSSTMHLLRHPGPAAILSNGLKSLGDELRVPSQAVNAAVTALVKRAHALLRLPLNDPDWVFSTGSPYGDPNYVRYCALWHEDYSGAPLQTLLLLALLAFVLACLLTHGRKARGLPLPTDEGQGLGAPRFRYSAASLGGALLYLALVRWNLWDTRLELPLYALAAAPLGLFLDRPRHAALVWAGAALLGAQGLWAACADQGHPLPQLFSRSLCAATVWANVPGIEPGYQAALRGSSLGLLEREHCCPQDGQCEFGVWVGAQRAGRPVRLQHLLATPATASLLRTPPWNKFQPDVIVADVRDAKTPELIWDGRFWRRLDQDIRWAVYLPEPARSLVTGARKTQVMDFPRPGHP